MHYIYILACADKTLYTGITTDLKRRFREHRAGQGGRYTAAHRPIKIKYSETCRTRSAALKREARIKRLTRAQKLALIKKQP